MGDVLDLDFSGLVPQARRILLVEPSRALAVFALVTVGAAVLWQVFPRSVRTAPAARAEFGSFPAQMGSWTGGERQSLDPDVAPSLAGA